MLAEYRFASLAEEVDQLVQMARPSARVNHGMINAMREVVGSVSKGIDAADVEVRREDRQRDEARRPDDASLE